MQTILDSMKFYVKTAYKTFFLLNPEVKLGKCLVKSVYIQYPEMFRFLRAENLARLGRRAYIVVTKFINNFINGNVLNQLRIQAEGQRVANKIAMITADKVQRREPNYYAPRLVSNVVPSNTYNPTVQLAQYYPFVYGTMRSNVNQRFKRQAENSKSEKQNSENNQQSIKSSTTSKQTYIDNENMDSEARIDLTNQMLEREAEELFNIDSMFWKNLGIEQNSIKKYSLAYCGKEYASDVFSRFIRNLLS